MSRYTVRTRLQVYYSYEVIPHSSAMSPSPVQHLKPSADTFVRDLSDVMEYAFNWDRTTQSRMFICCVAGNEIMVMSDNRDMSRNDGCEPLSIAFVPTICGRCERLKAHVGGQSLRIPLGHTLVESWKTYRVVIKDFGCTVDVISEIVDREQIMQKSKDFCVRLQTAEIDRPGAADGGQLRLLPHLDPSFL